MIKKICITLLFFVALQGAAYGEMKTEEETHAVENLTKEQINTVCQVAKSECESQSSFDFDIHSQTAQRCRELREACWKEAKDRQNYSWCTENIVCVPPRVKHDCSRLFPCSDIYHSVEFRSEPPTAEQPQS